MSADIIKNFSNEKSLINILQHTGNHIFFRIFLSITLLPSLEAFDWAFVCAQLSHTTAAPNPSSISSPPASDSEHGGMAWQGFLQNLQKWCPHSLLHVTQTIHVIDTNTYN